jgi:hypothetical protein
MAGSKPQRGVSNIALAWMLLGVVALAFAITLWKFRPL